MKVTAILIAEKTKYNEERSCRLISNYPDLVHVKWYHHQWHIKVWSLGATARGLELLEDLEKKIK